MPRKLITGGAYTVAKMDYLSASYKEDEPARAIAVNRMHARPLHPHGKRMIADGLMTLSRMGTKSSKHSALTITQAGIEELNRLRKRQAARDRKFAQNPKTPAPKKVTDNRPRFNAIKWSKAARNIPKSLSEIQ